MRQAPSTSQLATTPSRSFTQSIQPETFSRKPNAPPPGNGLDYTEDRLQRPSEAILQVDPEDVGAVPLRTGVEIKPLPLEQVGAEAAVVPIVHAGVLVPI